MRKPVSEDSCVRRRAFTHLELLNVLAVIVLSALLIGPAINATREAARRSQCNDNLFRHALVREALEGPGNRGKGPAGTLYPASSVWDQFDTLLFQKVALIGMICVAAVLVTALTLFGVDRSHLRKTHRDAGPGEEQPPLFILDRWFCPPSSSPT